MLHARGRYPGFTLVNPAAAYCQAVVVEPPGDVAELAEPQPEAQPAGEYQATKKPGEGGQTRDPEQHEARDRCRDRKARAGRGEQQSRALGQRLPSRCGR